MMKCLLLAGLVASIVTAQTDVPFKEELVRIGSAGVTHMNIRGFLVPRIEPDNNIPTFVFRTSPDSEIESTEGLLGFRCMPLDGIHATDEVPSKATLLCSGVAFQKKMIFLFGAEGFNFAPNEKAVNLMLEDKVVMNLKSVPETLLGSTILGDRVGRQFGGGFSGSGAHAGSVSFGGGGGLGGFPGGGFGGGISGSHASAGAGSFGGGGGFFG